MKKELTLAVCLLHLSVGYAQKADAGHPNVVFVYADDMGRGMLSHFGQENFSTPNIDRLFRQGESFEFAYGCMYSAPARASMLTGYHDCRQGRWNITAGGQYDLKSIQDLETLEKNINAHLVELPEGDLLLPQVFQQAGYVTGQFGKLDWGFSVTRQQIRKHGWDHYCGYMDHQHAHRFYPSFLFEDDSVLYIPQNTHPTEGRGFENESPANYKKRWDMTGKVVYSQDILLDRMLSFIRQHKDERFFLFHSTQLPHGPVAVPKVHPSVKDRTDLSEIEKEYASMVLMLDEHVGLLMKELEQQGLLENTIFIFSADNGHETYYTTDNRCRKSPVRDTEGKVFDAWDYPYRSDRTGDPFDGNNGLSGKKWMNWEGSVRVPLVFCWPGHIPAGRTLQQVVSNYDLLPTFADLLHVPLTTEKDGESLVPVLFNNKKKLKGERFVYVASPEGPAVISSNHWKLRYNKKLNKYRLHNLLKDYREETILNDKNPKMLEHLKDKLDELSK